MMQFWTKFPDYTVKIFHGIIDRVVQGILEYMEYILRYSFTACPIKSVDMIVPITAENYR